MNDNRFRGVSVRGTERQRRGILAPLVRLLERDGMVKRPATFVLLGVAVLASAFGLSTSWGSRPPQSSEVALSDQIPQKEPPREAIRKIHPAIPVYSGASFRDDLTERDRLEIVRQFGEPAEVYTLATDDAFPKVWHYYVTYLAQYRGFQPPRALPDEKQSWRTMQINLDTAMRDPFIPDPAGDLKRQVLLQLTETEGHPHTVIRYIVTGGAPRAAQVTAN